MPRQSARQDSNRRPVEVARNLPSGISSCFRNPCCGSTPSRTNSMTAIADAAVVPRVRQCQALAASSDGRAAPGLGCWSSHRSPARIRRRAASAPARAVRTGRGWRARICPPAGTCALPGAPKKSPAVRAGPVSRRARRRGAITPPSAAAPRPIRQDQGQAMQVWRARERSGDRSEAGPRHFDQR
jgi:hypothetical protein